RSRAQRTLDGLAADGFIPAGIAHTVLTAASGNSPFLARLALRERAMLPQLFGEGPETIVAEARMLALGAADAETQSDAMARLRIAKRRAALAIALSDIGGIWPLEQVTHALTSFADACVRGALRFALRDAAAKAEMVERDGAGLEASTGLTVLAMGKYGA